MQTLQKQLLSGWHTPLEGIMKMGYQDTLNARWQANTIVTWSFSCHPHIQFQCRVCFQKGNNLKQAPKAQSEAILGYRAKKWNPHPIHGTMVSPANRAIPYQSTLSDDWLALGCESWKKQSPGSLDSLGGNGVSQHLCKEVCRSGLIILRMGLISVKITDLRYTHHQSSISNHQQLSGCTLPPAKGGAKRDICPDRLEVAFAKTFGDLSMKMVFRLQLFGWETNQPDQSFWWGLMHFKNLQDFQTKALSKILSGCFILFEHFFSTSNFPPTHLYGPSNWQLTPFELCTTAPYRPALPKPKAWVLAKQNRWKLVGHLAKFNFGWQSLKSLGNVCSLGSSHWRWNQPSKGMRKSILMLAFSLETNPGNWMKSALETDFMITLSDWTGARSVEWSHFLFRMVGSLIAVSDGFMSYPIDNHYSTMLLLVEPLHVHGSNTSKLTSLEWGSPHSLTCNARSKSVNKNPVWMNVGPYHEV